ncbi:MAG TPA: glycosyltransferase, partial [Thiothrix sp.]|nr:glycosyltransferase [Thiothrix sp.]
RANIILSTVRDYQPDMVLVDKKPLGLCGELQTALEALKTRDNPPSIFLLLRDILDNPTATQKVWRKRHYFQAIERYYERILVVGQADFFDLTTEYAFPTSVSKKLHYCGYIRREAGLQDSATIRAELGLQASQKLVLVTPGGGKDGEQLIIHYLQGIKNHPDPRRHSLVICGSEMSEYNTQHIHQLAQQCSHITLQRFSNDLMSYMEAADVVVSMLGYNTFCEILSTQKPAVVVPRVRPVEEQWIRATRMAQQGRLTAIHPDQLNAERLYQAVNALLSAPSHAPSPKTNPILRLTALPTINRMIAQSLQQQASTSNTKNIQNTQDTQIQTPCFFLSTSAH